MTQDIAAGQGIAIVGLEPHENVIVGRDARDRLPSAQWVGLNHRQFAV